MTELKRSHILYRFYNDADELLYVGITANPSRRLERHRHEKDWWSDVSRIDIEHFTDRHTVLAAERTAIETEKPRHNIRMNERPHPAQRLVWICEACDGEIADGDGWLTCSDFEVADTERIIRDIYENREPWSPIPLSEFPDHVHWYRYHCSCDPHADEGSYWIAVERIRTLPELLSWTAHLMQKRWLKATDWSYLIAGIAHRHRSTE